MWPANTNNKPYCRESPPTTPPKNEAEWSFYIVLFLFFNNLFHPAAYLRWHFSNIWCVIWRCLRKGANISKHKKRSRDFRLWQRQTFQHGNCPLPAALLLPHKGQPIDRGPLLLGNDIIILCRWMSAVLQTSPCNSDSTPYRLSLIFVFGWKL